MRRFLLPVCGLLIILFYGCKTKSDKAAPSNKTYTISMNGFDSLRLGMSKAELEAMLDTSFKLQHIKVDGGPYDTISTKYKGIDIKIYLNEGDDSTVATLYGILSSDSSFKTKEGITVGTEKEKLIDAYEIYTKYIAPIYDPYPQRSKTKSLVAVMDTAENSAMLFHIMNRKVSAVEIRSYYEFE